MNRRLWVGTFLVCLAGILAGCSAEKPASSGNVTKMDEKGFEEVLEKNKGKVILVDYWATWCGPCVASFPHTVEIGKEFEDKGLAVVTISFDALDDQNKVKAFLSQHETDKFENLLSSYDGPNSEAADAFKVEGFPTLRLYDRSGKMVWEKLGTMKASEERALKERIGKLLAT